jgi:peptidoglycan/LPS O-acetylase OafA/YrhL
MRHTTSQFGSLFYLFDPLSKLRARNPEVNEISSPARNVSVDALRTVSIVLVMVLHTLPYLSIPGLMRPNAGYFGVTLFFVISGFLITTVALRRYGNELAVPPWPFYRFRAARILPGVLIFTVLNAVMFLAKVPGFELVKSGPMALPELLFYVFSFQANVYALQGSLPNAWYVLWSLAIEEVFYVLFPIICFLAPSRRWLVSFLCLIVAFGPFWRYWTQGAGILAYFGCFDQLALGCLTALIVSGRKPSLRLSRSLQFSGLALFLYGYFQFNPVDVVGPTVVAFGGALFLAGSVHDETRSTFARIMTLPGQWSYEIYLFHMATLKLLYVANLYAPVVARYGMNFTFFATFLVIIAVAGFISVWILGPLSLWIRGQSPPAHDTITPERGALIV